MKLHLTIGVVIGCLLLLASCSSRKPPTATVPAVSREPMVLVNEEESTPVGAQSAAAFPEELVLIKERVTVPPLQPGTAIDLSAPAAVTEQQQVAPSPKSPPRRPRAGVSTSPTDGDQPTESDATTSESRPPSLKPMMSEQERRQLLNQTQANLERARRNLAGIQENRLDSNERDALRQARSFLTRAEQLRVTDPALASSMAERAAILSQELLRRQR